MSDFKLFWVSFIVLVLSIVINTENPVSEVLSRNIFDVKVLEKQAISVSLSFSEQKEEFSSPIDNPIVTSDYLDEREGGVKHVGIDLYSTTNDNVYASASGKFSEVGFDDEYGRYIIIEHEDGYETLYAHLAEVMPHTDVLQGEKIGVIGETGNATGEHLHFEIRKDKVQIDPNEKIDFYEN